MKKKPYIIGTRGSLLALTQCLQMKNIMEEKGLGEFQLKIISTQGDENTQVPLWQLEGKDFFTKELDAALLKGEVDLVVHSYKDLGSERPDGIKLATITQRNYAHDILFIKNETIEKLQRKELKEFTVGTSSPRRITNIERFLKDYLPYGSEVNLNIKCSPLRGNVNTRLEKLVQDKYDAIVLALPGIERLAQGLPNQDNEAFQKHGDPLIILKDLLKNLNFMVLPLSDFPAAASQGALAIECLNQRNDNGELLQKLEDLSCERTLKEVGYEREVFQSFGGGCHLAVGISARWNKHSGLSRLNVRGKVDELEIDRHNLKGRVLPKLPDDSKGIFVGIPSSISYGQKSTLSDQLTRKVSSINNKLQEVNNEHLFITSGSALSYALEFPENTEILKNSPLWSSGTHTMKKIAARGFWCHGSADSLGEAEVASLSEGHLVTLKCGKRTWKVITNETSQGLLGPTIGVYKKSIQDVSPEYKKNIEDCKVYFWTSFPQYEEFSRQFNLTKGAQHCCGLGKTLLKFEEANIEVLPFSSMREFNQWITQK